MKVLLFMLSAAGAWAADAVVFTPSPAPGVTNYTLYYGTNRAQLGLATGWTITNVAPASAVSLHATAWANGIESDPSNTLLYTNRGFAPVIRLTNQAQTLTLQMTDDLQTWRTLAVITSGDPPLTLHPMPWAAFRLRQ